MEVPGRRRIPPVWNRTRLRAWAALKRARPVVSASRCLASSKISDELPKGEENLIRMVSRALGGVRGVPPTSCLPSGGTVVRQVRDIANRWSGIGARSRGTSVRVERPVIDTQLHDGSFREAHTCIPRRLVLSRARCGRRFHTGARRREAGALCRSGGRRRRRNRGGGRCAVEAAVALP